MKEKGKIPAHKEDFHKNTETTFLVLCLQIRRLLGSSALTCSSLHLFSNVLCQGIITKQVSTSANCSSALVLEGTGTQASSAATCCDKAVPVNPAQCAYHRNIQCWSLEQSQHYLASGRDSLKNVAEIPQGHIWYNCCNSLWAVSQCLVFSFGLKHQDPEESIRYLRLQCYKPC